jgi:hypothetical protein
MTIEGQDIDAKIVDRLRKLLALARDGGATEGEANSAMELAQKIALNNNISFASIELAGGSSGDEGKRVKDSASGEGKRSWAQYPYQRELMETCGKVNFCHVSLRYGNPGKKHRPVAYDLIGREGNVVTAKEMFTYLITTINRLLLAHNNGDHRQGMSRYSMSWKAGCAERLRERLIERHNAMLAEQKREANERNVAARHPAAATGTALVVVMEDFAQAEEDRNRDFRCGLPEGTTAAQRAEDEAYDREARARRQEALEAAKAAGATERELEIMRLGYSLQRAREYLLELDAPDTRSEAEKKKAAEKEARENARWERKWRQQDERERNRYDARGYVAGQRAGESIGLDKQVGQTETRKIVNRDGLDPTTHPKPRDAR